MKKAIVFLAVLFFSTYAHAQNAENVVGTYLSSSCDSVELYVPIGATKGTAQYLLSQTTLKQAGDASPTSDTYMSDDAKLIVILSYTGNKVTTVFMFVAYDKKYEAIRAKNAVNAGLEQAHGEMNSKTEHYHQVCDHGTYVRRATVTELSKGQTYLSLAIIKIN